MRFFASPWRISGIAGLLFVVLSLVASGMNVQPPSYDQAPAAFVAWFAESSQRFRIGHFIAGRRARGTLRQQWGREDGPVRLHRGLLRPETAALLRE